MVLEAPLVFILICILSPDYRNQLVTPVGEDQKMVWLNEMIIVSNSHVPPTPLTAALLTAGRGVWTQRR
jgi:hypothetical protein